MASGFPNLPGFAPNYPIDVIFYYKLLDIMVQKG